MAITSVSGTTFTEDLVLLLRDKLDANITDPIAAGRPVGKRFVFTSYPKENVLYPMISIKDLGTRQELRMGMQSEGTALRLGVEIRIWARNVKERDVLFDEVYTWLRTNQYGGSDSLVDANLHDFSLDSVVNISEPDVKSKIMEVTFLFIAE